MSETTAPAPQTSPATEALPAPQPAALPAAGTPHPVPGPPPGGGTVFTADYVQALRGEAAGYRTQLREAQAGLEKMTTEMEAIKAQADRATELEATLARHTQDQLITKALTGKNASPIALAAMRGENIFKDIDWDAKTIAEDLTSVIDEFLKTNPELVTVPGAPRSGAPQTGGTGEGTITPEQFAAMGAAQRNELFQTNSDLYRALTGR